MSEEPTSTPAPISSVSRRSPKADEVLIIRMWPKTPILYPMALVALICSLVAHFAGSSELSDYPFAKPDKESAAPANGATDVPADDPLEDNPAPETSDGNADASRTASEAILAAQAGASPTSSEASDFPASDQEKKRLDRTLAVFFLLALFVSLFSVCVDMDVRWGLIYISSIVIVILVLWIVNISTDFLPTLLGWLDRITPMANAQFYLAVALLWLVLFMISVLVTRFHYVRIEPNEVIVVGGMLERQQRYSTMRMRYVKEIHDVMEYYLPFVRSGRLILSFPEHSEAVIIDNVINIRKVTAKLDHLVSALQVKD